MRQMNCEACGQSQPMNEMFRVQGRALCRSCGDALLREQERGRIPEGAVVRIIDPTVCENCKSDAGTVELSRVAGMPLCEACHDRLVRRRFPGWVKISFAVILGLVCLETVRNWRLFQAYLEIPRAQRALEDGRAEEAADLLESAARHVPEWPSLAEEAKFLRGLALCEAGRFADAAKLLEEYRKSLPSQEAKAVEPYVAAARIQDLIDRKESSQAVAVALEFREKYPKDPMAAELLSLARIAEAFDGKNYDEFLALARDRERLNPDDARTKAQVASALACKYAVTGEEHYRTECMTQMEKARAAADKDTDLAQYEERILHRLKTREIIDKEEYDRRFRTGAGKGPDQ